MAGFELLLPQLQHEAEGVGCDLAVSEVMVGSSLFIHI